MNSATERLKFKITVRNQVLGQISVQSPLRSLGNALLPATQSLLYVDSIFAAVPFEILIDARITFVRA